LPPVAITNICTMLAMSRIGDEYSGIEVLRNLAEPAQLTELAHDIFHRWAAAGHPAQQDWALDALGLLGDDTTVEMLVPLLRTWPLESGHRRAATGLDVLSSIGSDNALHALWQISEGLRFPALRKKADASIERIADELDLSPEDLADRVIPRFGFDDRSTLVIDYGWTSFTVSLTSKLQPGIAAVNGEAVRELPAPSAADAPEAHDAYKKYAKVRRDLRFAASELISRLERAMVTERRWTVDALKTRYVQHPLMWPLTRALLWVTDDGVLFRFDDLLREPTTEMGHSLVHR